MINLCVFFQFAFGLQSVQTHKTYPGWFGIPVGCLGAVCLTFTNAMTKDGMNQNEWIYFGLFKILINFDASWNAARN